MHNSSGFTLAEVLVTLAIIGVVATLTIPSLVQSVQNNQYKAAYIKVYADYNAAILKANADNALLAMTSGISQNNITNFKTVETYFSVIKDCSSNNNSACWSAGESFRSTPYADAYAFIDSSGRSWSTRAKTADGSVNTSVILVDTNGFKEPNQYGKDRFPVAILDSHSSTVDIPVRIYPYSEFVDPDPLNCPSGGCYNMSWLTGGT